MKSLILAAFLIAIVLGGWRIVTAQLVRDRAAATTVQASRTGQIERLRLEKAGLQAELANKTNPAAVEPTGSQPMPRADVQPVSSQAASQYLAKLIADGTVKLGTSSSEIDALTPTSSGAFPAKFGKLFHLDDARMMKLQDDMITIKNRVDASITNHTTVTRNADGSVVIACAPLPEGETLRQEFRALLVGAIGQEGLATYLALRPENPQSGSGGIGDFYNAFGVNGAIWTITQETTGNPPEKKTGVYQYRRTGALPGRTTGNISSRGGNTPRSQLLTLLGPQAAFLPADF